MRTILLFYLSILLLGAGFRARAQQLLCERELRTTAPSSVRPAALLRLQPDSLRLLNDYNPSGPNQLRVRLTRVESGQCDTLPTRTATLLINGPGSSFSLAATNQRGQVLLTQALVRPQAAGAFDSIRIVLQFLNRDGSLRWRRTLAPQAIMESVSGLVEAPGNGFFLVGLENAPSVAGLLNQYDIILRIDSTGRELWRRRYRRLINDPLGNPTYTRSGTLVCTADYTRPGGAATELTLMEFNQRGDSLNTRHVVITPQQHTRLPLYSTNALSPLRDGGFALVGYVDSAGTGNFRHFLARLSPQGAVIWSHVYRSQPMRLDQPKELADGSLVVVANNLQSGRGYPFWLFRFSATGALQQRYPFVSQVLTPNTSGGRVGFFGIAQGLQPLSDSTLVVAASAADLSSSRIYLAHLRVPGLPRVIDSQYVPAADPLTARAPATAWPGGTPFPNPAADQATVPYHLPPSAHAAQLMVHNALGRIVYQQALDPRQAQAVLSVNTWPPGLYLLTLLAHGHLLGRQRLAVAR